MKMTVIIECDCGNYKTYRVKEEDDCGDKYLDLSETMDDEQFTSSATPQGTTIRCKCRRTIDII